MKKSYLKFILAFFITFTLNFVTNAQTPGLIYKPSGTPEGKSVLDPNGDGYTSISSSGFSGIDYGAQSELSMISIPLVMNEPTGDLSTGATGGHTEIVSLNGGNSVLVLKKNVAGTDYFIVRFRIGNASTAHKGYSLLIDTNNQFGNTSSSNPGFEKEIVLETGSGVKIYTHNVATGTSTFETFNLEQHHQRSIALSTNNGDADYFYDFYVPFNNLGISSNVRFAATTITSAQSGISGTASDINGINDALYGGNINLIYSTIINSFPPTNLNNLTAGMTFASLITSSPTITSSLTTASNSISGTSQEVNGTLITVYKNGVFLGTATVNSNTWTLTGISGLIAGNLIKATATASGKSVSADSNIVEVTKVQTCFVASPVIVSRNNGAQTITGTWSNGLPITPNTVRIRIYEQTAANTFVELNAAVAQYVAIDGTFTVNANVSQSAFNPMVIYITATFGSCTSGFSNGILGNSGTITPAPTITNSQIIANTGATNVTVQSNFTASTLILYVNDVEVGRSPSAVNSGSTYVFSYTGFIKGDIVVARAQGNLTTNYLSNKSNILTVIGSAVQTSAPTISGTYVNGNTSVSGTSIEIAGTIINLYKNGITLIGTTTVNAFGNWTVTGLSLITGDVITATADASGKTLSNSSNSITVAAGTPAAPTVTAGISSGATSIAGSGGLGTIIIYVDGTQIGTTSGTSWTLSSINPNEIYKGAIITAKNLVSGILSNSSNQVTVTGVVSFKLTNTSDASIGTKTAGELFDIKIAAKDAVSGTGNTVTTFTNNVVLSSNSSFLSGNGATSNFTAGILNPHQLALTTAGSRTITAVSTTDPTAIGTATLTIVAGPASKYIMSVSSTSISGGDQITVTAQLTDFYNNPVNTEGVSVNWSSTNGGTFSSNPTFTNSNGLATVTFTSVNTNTTHIITATSSAISGTSETVVVTTTLSSEDEIISKTVNLYPNPVKNKQLFLKLLEHTADAVEIALYNQLGIRVYQTTFKAVYENSTMINLPSNLSSGMYILKINLDKKTINKKIVIE